MQVGEFKFMGVCEECWGKSGGGGYNWRVPATNTKFTANEMDLSPGCCTTIVVFLLLLSVNGKHTE